LVFPDGRLNLDDFSGRLIFIQTVEKQINVTGARYFPIKVLLPDELECNGNGDWLCTGNMSPEDSQQPG
jgi:hypothetical protein